ncbi:phosphatase PAP2 family protein [Variovorax boronicumulans]|uniref:phosphatase PAP2 family protein n=1 Tax=Variovorax boronicumulans TaxID=436515 RepID=UPI000A64DA68|nr:phosphatase PAP2 family protein [Variovorax boronicumulans]
MLSNKLERLANIKGWLIAISIVTVMAELLQTALTGRPTIVGFAPSAKLIDILYFLGAFAGVPAAVFWIANLADEKFKKIAPWVLIFGFFFYFFHLLKNEGQGLYSPSSAICLIVAPLGIFSLIFFAFSLEKSTNGVKEKTGTSYFYLVIILGLLSVATNSGLHSNKILYPATWDYFVYRIDFAYGGVANSAAIIFDALPPFLQAATNTVYGVLIFGLYGVLALAIRQNDVARLNVWAALAIPFALAFVFYSFLPLSGPVYAFFSGEFPHQMPLIGAVTAAQVVIPPAYRNGMPSMHFTGALLVWMLSVGLRNRLAVGMSIVLVLGTAWATLALGEHYLLDLVVALPYAAFLGVALIWPSRLRANYLLSAPIWCAGGVFLGWMVLLRVAPVWLAESSGFVEVFSIFGALSAGVVFLGVWRQRNDEIQLTPKRISNSAARASEKPPGWVIAVFFVSGLAGLIYEVVYAKALAVTFGGTALASYTVLATYMGGMALGAWIGGKIADQSKNALQAYALCETLIGIYAAATPLLFKLIQNAYVYISLDVAPDAAWLTPFRLMLGAACLGVPTILMGATFPLMFKYLRDLGISSSNSIAPLYAANVIGAAVGSIVAAYFILPAVGRNGGTYVAAIISLMVALFVIERNKRSISLRSGKHAADENQYEKKEVLRIEAGVGVAAILILFVGGGVTLGLEINSMHLLAIVAGNSVYAFGLMLAMFLVGLGLGSICGEKLIGKFHRIQLIFWAQCGLALSVALTAQIWDGLPSYFASFSLYPIALPFSAREAIRALVCMIAMFPPAFFIGMSYPAAMGLATDWLSPDGGAKGLGFASAVNTLGNIFGVIFVGFWVLPEFGSRDTAFFFGIAALLLAALAFLVGLRRERLTSNKGVGMGVFKDAWPIPFVVIGFLLFPKQWNYDDLSTGANVYFSGQSWGQVIDHAESVEGGLTTVARNSQNVSILLTNGKFQGNNSTGGEMVAQESFALFPLLHTGKRNSALVIGYGTGMTARVFYDHGFSKIDVAETSRDIVKMADRHFESINLGVSSKPGVKVNYTDGRNFLLTQSKLFDVISVEITSIWFAGAANLYNKEFYSLAKSRLSNEGVLQQWIQLHHISTMDLIYAIGSVRSEFKYVWLYVRGGQGIVVASNNEESLNLPGEASLVNYEASGDLDLQPDALKSHLILSPNGVDNLISNFDPTMQSLISTDQNLYLEHSTPKGNSLGDVLRENILRLSEFEKKKVLNQY